MLRAAAAPLKLPRNSVLRNAALSRFFGCSGTNGLLQTSGQSSTSWTMSVKMEVEAPFYAVQLMRVNRSGLNSLNGDKALVGVTESNDITALNGLTATQNIAVPIIRVAGTPTAYGQIAPAGTLNGFFNVTWPGKNLASLSNVLLVATAVTTEPHGLVTGNTITLTDSDTSQYNVTNAAITFVSVTSFTFAIASDPGANPVTLGEYSSNACGTVKPTTNQTYSISNIAPLQSAASRIDGGARPLLLYRYWHNGTVQSFPFHSVTAALRSASAPMRSRTIQVGAYLADGIATPNGTFSIDTVLMDVYPIIHYAVPVFSIWHVGDSTTQCDALVADKVSTWLYRASLSVSTPTRPVTFANFGASSQTSATYWQQAKNALAAGAPPPSALFIGVDSVNDGVNTVATVQSAYALAEDIMSTCSKYGISIVVFVPRMPYNTLNAAQYALKVTQDAALTTLAAAYSVKLMTLPGLGDGANPERWVPALNNAADGIHPNETAIETPLATTIGAPFIADLVNSYY